MQQSQQGSRAQNTGVQSMDNQQQLPLDIAEIESFFSDIEKSFQNMNQPQARQIPAKNPSSHSDVPSQPSREKLVETNVSINVKYETTMKIPSTHHPSPNSQAVAVQQGNSQVQHTKSFIHQQNKAFPHPSHGIQRPVVNNQHPKFGNQQPNPATQYSNPVRQQLNSNVSNSDLSNLHPSHVAQFSNMAMHQSDAAVRYQNPNVQYQNTVVQQQRHAVPQSSPTVQLQQQKHAVPQSSPTVQQQLQVTHQVVNNLRQHSQRSQPAHQGQSNLSPNSYQYSQENFQNSLHPQSLAQRLKPANKQGLQQQCAGNLLQQPHQMQQPQHQIQQQQHHHQKQQQLQQYQKQQQYQRQQQQHQNHQRQQQQQYQQQQHQNQQQQQQQQLQSYSNAQITVQTSASSYPSAHQHQNRLRPHTQNFPQNTSHAYQRAREAQQFVQPPLHSVQPNNVGVNPSHFAQSVQRPQQADQRSRHVLARLAHADVRGPPPPPSYRAPPPLQRSQPHRGSSQQNSSSQLLPVHHPHLPIDGSQQQSQPLTFNSQQPPHQNPLKPNAASHCQQQRPGKFIGESANRISPQMCVGENQRFVNPPQAVQELSHLKGSPQSHVQHPVANNSSQSCAGRLRSPHSSEQAQVANQGPDNSCVGKQQSVSYRGLGEFEVIVKQEQLTGSPRRSDCAGNYRLSKEMNNEGSLDVSAFLDLENITCRIPSLEYPRKERSSDCLNDKRAISEHCSEKNVDLQAQEIMTPPQTPPTPVPSTFRMPPSPALNVKTVPDHAHSGMCSVSTSIIDNKEDTSSSSSDVTCQTISGAAVDKDLTRTSDSHEQIERDSPNPSKGMYENSSTVPPSNDECVQSSNDNSDAACQARGSDNGESSQTSKDKGFNSDTACRTQGSDDVECTQSSLDNSFNSDAASQAESTVESLYSEVLDLDCDNTLKLSDPFSKLDDIVEYVHITDETPIQGSCEERYVSLSCENSLMSARIKDEFCADSEANEKHFGVERISPLERSSRSVESHSESERRSFNTPKSSSDNISVLGSKSESESETVTASDENHLYIYIPTDKLTGRIVSLEEIPECCPMCYTPLCPSYAKVNVSNYSIRILCIKCGLNISLLWDKEPVSKYSEIPCPKRKKRKYR